MLIVASVEPSFKIIVVSSFVAVTVLVCLFHVVVASKASKMARNGTSVRPRTDIGG
ncbi:hypothetical protein D3C75_1345500 [compost metagenome]